MVLSTKLTENKVDELYNQKESQDEFIYLGKGGTGVVYRYGYHAIKIIPTEKFNQSEYELSRYFNKLLDENITINFLRTYNLYEFDNEIVSIQDCKTKNIIFDIYRKTVLFRIYI